MKVLMTPQRYRIIETVQRCPRWLTSKEIARAAGVSDSTARHTALALAQVGVFNQWGFHKPILYSIGELTEDWKQAMEVARDYAAQDMEIAD